MPITIDDLTINPTGIDLEKLLSEWEWAMPESLRPVLLTATGDVFAQGPSGTVYFMDMVEGQVRPVADDGDSFRNLLKDSKFVTDHTFPSRILECRNAGLTLGARQVYSHKTPLVLGGADSIENLEATDAAVHISIHGQIHRQVSQLPEGTPVSEIKIEY